MRWFKKHAKDIVRGQLATVPRDYGKDVSKRNACFRSRGLLNFLARPQFIAYRIGHRPLAVRFSETLGAMRFGWTARNERAERGRDAVIFEFYRPQLRFK